MARSKLKRWVLVVAAVSTATLWILAVASGWFILAFVYPVAGPARESAITLGAGSIMFGALDAPMGTGVHWQHDESGRSPYWLVLPGTFYSAIAIPLWIPAVLSSFITLVFWQARKGAVPGRCPTCGYDISARPNESTPCPECGEIAKPPPPMPEVPDATLWPRRRRRD